MSDTWRALLEGEMENRGDPGPVLAWAPGEASFDVEFDAGYGLPEGPPVLAWTAARVYFPVSYDGAEWIASAPRNPQPEPEGHVA